jgi:hypothetical protein
VADSIITMGAGKIGLVVRGKTSATDDPDLMAQHADCILADGSPIGFYGEGNDQSGNAIGLRMTGVVYDYAMLRTQRIYYVDFESAVAYSAISTTLLVTATPAQAKAFAESWNAMKSNPGSFNIVGDNCSSHASKAFIEAGLLPGGIPGLDTPNNLYKQLVATLPGKTTSMSGYIGFIKRSGGGFNIKYRPYVAPVGAPAAGKRFSSF